MFVFSFVLSKVKRLQKKKRDDQENRQRIRPRLRRAVPGNRGEPAPVQEDNTGEPAHEQEPQVLARKREVLAGQEDGEVGPELVLPTAHKRVLGHDRLEGLCRQQEQLPGQVGRSVRLHQVPPPHREEEPGIRGREGAKAKREEAG